jgi:putative methyltransferase (TIGR04325 family)
VSHNNNDEWLAHLFSQIDGYLRGDSDYHPYPPKQSLLNLLVALTGANRILDLGGSNGWHYQYLNRSIENLSISDYDIIEVSSVRCAFRNYYKNQSIPSYLDEPAPSEHYDILYSNSALQYIPDAPAAVGRILCGAHPKYVLLEDLIIDAKPGRYAQDWRGKEINFYVHDFEILARTLIDLNYKIVLRQPYLFLLDGVRSAFEIVDGLGAKCLVPSTWSLLFRYEDN